MSVARHTLYNSLGAAVPVLVSLATVPLYVSVVGLPRYGILAIAWLLLGYMNLMDLGLGRAISQKLATLAGAAPEDRSRVFWTALSLSGGLILIAVCLFFPIAHVVMMQIQFDSAGLQREVTVALPWLAAIIPFGLTNGVLNGALEGRRQFLRINIISSLSTVGSALLPLTAAILFGSDLWHLIAATLLARGFSIALLSLACRRAVPVLPYARPRRSIVGGLVRFGGWAAITNAVGPLLHFWDRFAIGALISSAAVGLYVIPFNLVAQLAVLPNALASALFPRIAESDVAHARTIAAESVSIIAFVVTPISMTMLFLGGPFLAIWLGEATAIAVAPVMFLLIGGAWANSLARIAFADLQARGRPDLPALGHLAQLLPYIILLYFTLPLFGIQGAAAIWSLRCLVDAGMLLFFSRVGLRTLSPLLVDVAVIGMAMTCALMLPLWSIAKMAAILVLALVWLALAWNRRPQRLVAMAGGWLTLLRSFRERKLGGN